MTSQAKTKTFITKFNLLYDGIKEFHLSGENGGVAVAHKYSNEVDKLISTELNIDYKSKGIVILALGGYGRRELCLKSDIDILILYEKSKADEAKGLAENILYKLWDTGLEIGNSLRTIEDCLELASMQDSTILTSLLDLRAIAGDSILHTTLKNRLNKTLLPNISQNFIDKKILERKMRYEKYGTSDFLREPDIKEGQGCLRDIHSCFWILRAFYCQIEIDRFLDGNFLNREEIRTINESLDFLLQVRNHLHINKSSEFDIIDSDFQTIAADFFKIKDEDFLTKENVFMKTLYGTTNKIGQLTDKIIQRTLDKNKKIFSSKRIQNLDDFYIIHRGTIRAINPAEILHNPSALLTPFEYSATNNTDIADEVLTEIKKIKTRRFSMDDKRALNKKFLELLKKGKGTCSVLSNINRYNLISFFIPEFEKVKDLVVADPSHIYTVDIHSLLLIEEFEKLVGGTYETEFPLETEIARGLRKKEVFYLTGLLHDIGKGYGNNHARRGSEMVQKICDRLFVDKESIATIEFLIKEHLSMSSCSQKRDLDDNRLIKEFKDRVGTVERLNYLFVLTFCDLRSVAPDVWSGWKGNLLSTLFKKTIILLSKRKKGGAKASQLSIKNRKEIEVFKQTDRDKFEKIGGKRISTYFDNYSAEELVYQIQLLLSNDGSLLMGIKYSQQNQIDQLTIWSKDCEVGFVEICAVLSSSNINIFSGRVTPLKKSLVLYTFEVNRFGQSTFRERGMWNSIKKNLTSRGSLLEPKPLSRKRVGSMSAKVKTKINVDNSSSKNFTIIELSATDRPGLLYDISKTLKDYGLVIGFVKISTKRGSVDDSFYIKKIDGKKLVGTNDIRTIKNNLTEIVSYET